MVNPLSIILILTGLFLGVSLDFILRKKKSKELIEKAMQEANQVRNKAKSEAESMEKETRNYFKIKREKFRASC